MQSPSESEQLSPAQQSIYLSFTRKLAHNEKKTRDRAVRFVAKWLAHQPKASEADLRKLWQGLFFCLWHADKLIIQAEVATSIAGLMHSGKTVEAGMRYLAAGLWTLHQRWMTIDRHRVDKFLSLLRHLLRQALLVLARHQWRAEDIARFAQVMKTYPLGSADKSVPLCPGITLHFADIFMDELKLAVETGADGEGNLELRAGAMNDVLEPFLYALAQHSDKVILQRIEERVLGPFIRGAVRHVELAPTSPLRFVDYTALANRFFEIAASKETKDSHRARFYRYKKELQKILETPSVRRMELEAPEANGTNHHHHQNGNGLTKETEEVEEAESKADEEDEEDEEAEEEENGHEENGTEETVEHMNGQDEDEHKDEGEEEEQSLVKKRKHGVVKRHSKQPTWMLAFLKKPRLSLNTLPMPDDDDEEEDNNTAAAQPPAKRRTGPRLRFSLESNSIQEFRKIDPPAKLGSSPVPNRKPTTSILKGSPLVKPAAPRL